MLRQIWYSIILRNRITESYHGIISRNILLKRVLDIPREPLEPAVTCRDPLGTPLGPHRDAPVTPRGTPGTRPDHKNGHISKTL